MGYEVLPGKREYLGQTDFAEYGGLPKPTAILVQGSSIWGA